MESPAARATGQQRRPYSAGACHRSCATVCPVHRGSRTRRSSTAVTTPECLRTCTRSCTHNTRHSRRVNGRTQRTATALCAVTTHTSRHNPARQQLHNTSQSSTAQHSTAQHSTAQHSTAQHSTAQHSTAQHSTTPLVEHALARQHGSGLVREQDQSVAHRDGPTTAFTLHHVWRRDGLWW